METLDPTPEQLVQVATVMHRLVADRVGNDVAVYEQLGDWERRKFEGMAAAAIRKWEAIRISVNPT